MKTNRFKNILLGALVILIWGLIVFRIFVYVKNPSIDEPTAYSGIDKSAGLNVLKESFTINATYRDPFLKEISVTNDQRSVSALPVFNKSNEGSNRIDWPLISFNGTIKASDKKSIVGILNINNICFLVKEKDTINDIIIDKLYTDSTHVIYSNEKRTFVKVK